MTINDDNNDDDNNENCELVTHFYSSSPSFYFRFENKFANQRNDNNDNEEKEEKKEKDKN